MNKRRKPAAKTPAPHQPRKAVPISTRDGDSPDQTGVRVAVQLAAPELAAWRVIASAERDSGLGELIDTPGMLAALRSTATAVNAGDMNRVEAMLMCQATALQTLFARLIERGVVQELLPQYEAHMRLALKAQAQSRATLETLANVRNGPAIYARQANVTTGGPMQVNNGPSSSPCARQIQDRPNQLLELPAHDRLDSRTQSCAGQCNPPLEAVGEKHRSENA